ncbi:HlyD family type I secretion periplasmic adaptor subunit [Celeribacter marinus]|uniref:HlyD family type I secretion periplasmic adaptor subunit n=1 Tax=Celeribacter marinus TaxID=1397108 RepID=UPI003175AC78
MTSSHKIQPTSNDAQWGAARLLTIGFLLVALLVVGFGGWAAFARIDGAVVASGKLQVDQNRQEVAHRDGGVVATLNVREGDTVTAGTPLLTLSANELQNDLRIAESQLYDMIARSARLEAERDHSDKIAFPQDLLDRADGHPEMQLQIAGQVDLFSARKLTQQKEIEQLEKRKTQIAAQIDGLNAQRAALEEQRTLAQADLVDQASLRERGLTQQSRVTALRKEVIGLSGELGRIDATIAQADAQITEIDLSILKLASDSRETAISELREVQNRTAQLHEQVAALAARKARLVITAPMDGIIYDLSVFGPGAVISPAEPLLYIVPQDRPLVISARISPTHIDQVYPGQSVRLRFTTFDQRRTPELIGTLTRISADAFTDDMSGATFYLAEISLSDAQKQRLPAGSELLPGMPVEAFMSTGERTPLAYLTKPLTDYFNRAFREN